MSEITSMEVVSLSGHDAFGVVEVLFLTITLGLPSHLMKHTVFKLIANYA